MKTIPIWLGTLPLITDTIVDDATGLPLDLTGDVVSLVVQDPTGAQSTFVATANPDQVGHRGEVSIVTPVAVSVAQQYWLAWWRVTAPGPQTRETPTFALQILVHGQETPVPVGPCAGWITGVDVLKFCEDMDPGLAETLAGDASDLMFGILGRQFRGVCQDIVRPTRLGCSCWLSGSPAGGGWPITWGFWSAFGMPGWSWSDALPPAGCGWISEYPLSYPVSQILAVKVGGSVLDPARYRVDEQRLLVRLDDSDGSNPGWPVCQNMLLDDSKPGTWSVSFTYGIAPPQLARDAAAALACQLGQSISGGDCALPVGTTKVTRQGIEINRGLFADFTKGGSTGIPLVDAAIRAYNPNQLQIQSQVWSPDLPTFGRHVG